MYRKAKQQSVNSTVCVDMRVNFYFIVCLNFLSMPQYDFFWYKNNNRSFVGLSFYYYDF